MKTNKLIIFLKILGVYEKFTTNIGQYEDFLEKHFEFKRDHLNNIIKINENNPWVISSFAWDKTPEGIFFWKEISDLWKRIC